MNKMFEKLQDKFDLLISFIIQFSIGTFFVWLFLLVWYMMLTSVNLIEDSFHLFENNCDTKTRIITVPTKF
jgi:hypothetical protein